jgi:hypothetical protein
MTGEFNAYKAGIHRCLDAMVKMTCANRYEQTREWYQSDGRDGFIGSFEHETSAKLVESRAEAQRVELGLPKSLSDADNKSKDKNFYAAHAEWFLKETDRIFDADAKCQPPKFEPYYVGLNNIIQKYLLDSMVLLEDFAQWHQGVPDVFGIGKSRIEHNVGLYHAGLQAIYGTYSPLSFSDNHADTAISHLRMNIELRLRHGFGILGLTDTKDGSFVPLGLSKVLASVSQHQSKITLSTQIAHIDRIYRWANLYMHGGFKLYTWCAPAALSYLRPFLVGGSYMTAGKSGSSTFAGIQATKAVILDVQNTVQAAVQAELKDPSRYTLETIPPEDCQIILIDP